MRNKFHKVLSLLFPYYASKARREAIFEICGFIHDKLGMTELADGLTDRFICKGEEWDWRNERK